MTQPPVGVKWPEVGKGKSHSAYIWFASERNFQPLLIQVLVSIFRRLIQLVTLSQAIPLHRRVERIATYVICSRVERLLITCIGWYRLAPTNFQCIFDRTERPERGFSRLDNTNAVRAPARSSLRGANCTSSKLIEDIMTSRAV